MRGTILDYSTQIESLLVDLGAEGRGMHEKINSIESLINPLMVKKLRWLATIRNKAVHEADFSTDINEFVENANKTISFLQNLLTERKKQQSHDTKDESKKDTNDSSYRFDWESKSDWEKVGIVGLVAGSVIAKIYFALR